MQITLEICSISILLSSINTMAEFERYTKDTPFQFYLVLLIPCSLACSPGHRSISILLSSINTLAVSSFILKALSFQFYLVLLILVDTLRTSQYNSISILLSSINTIFFALA